MDGLPSSKRPDCASSIGQWMACYVPDEIFSSHSRSLDRPGVNAMLHGTMPDTTYAIDIT